ncbi:hypothetical protein MHL31_00785 [Lutibacter sp. A80]|uniref:hypothetical protein n=1 Tax=Lutibacter sp. A80 TaxID=2918453 RepID=UPI001F05D5BB|nr:hypothetical protein [Lutibacter sp. A80]UMB60763.1 hypothetical protein MHL31_00785 [Lutibacter sp. A80]
MKLLGLHSLTHDNDKEHAAHCDICEQAIIHNSIPVLSTVLQSFEIQNIELITKSELINNYKFISSSGIYLDKLLSRPPPFFT